ncbi:putative enoyl-CoA hydratase/Enoyl-CoA isomerase/3-hydroxyacyl-CoA dehydrogenase [Leishmania mexicana MHOM/GT/2001/U1103]|uniref:Enoyl-CoA hydratase/Enoyl-CoA isomerase/3-hydroxyacyl-CoA dehydrogenase n=1 Tax=Leishmania mexicana (strain MHOM/GT/2001/U1103) TaxID=929439 RepID=E9B4A0_LEIMU|nr:putative enoyl-CoA hydratase/Enoyl-CoA isomerase/3-hydroxyacyl-CoA dehydrogenase [Leishmania mexicana MHOM/GT/2001/U1103]CBZ30068.1 putative enoyl-CoA hydratase/Enoyl-CoA isomerase/3-hydroxyacyl-CoA dehydrogenase [Leishmania mexicana MHOM/GT/2001/U1103]
MKRLETVSKHLQDNEFVRVERRGGVGLIRMLSSAPPRSHIGGCVLCAPMRAQVLRALKTLEADADCRLIVLTSTSHRFFSSGIDIANFTECFISDPTAQPPVPSLSELTAAVAMCSKVCVAIIQGLCSSWGLELALAADYRICEVNAQFRFPEVRFGITPGGGGAQRLVCLVGVPHALNMLCYGRRVYAKEAYRIGLIDVPAYSAPHFWTALAEFIEQHVTPATPGTPGGHGEKATGLNALEEAQAAKTLALHRRRTCSVYAKHAFLSRGWYAWMEHKLRDAVPREVRAPHRAIEAVKLAVAHSCRLDGSRGVANWGSVDERVAAAAYVAAERALFESCLLLPETQAMQHLMRASQRTSMSWEKPSIGQQRPVQGLAIIKDRSAAVHVAVNPPLSAAPVSDVLTDDATARLGLKKVAVIGAGTMGTSIALMLLWQSEIEVILVEAEAHRQEVARRTIEDYLRSRVETHRLSRHRCDDMLHRLRVMGSHIVPFPPVLADADLVFECAPEVAAIKQNILAGLDSVCKRSTIFATGSSAQDVNELAAVTQRPGQVLGIHFFPPANESPLVEVIRGAATERWVVERVMHLLCQLDKYPILSVSRHGYVGTRLLLTALYQAYAMLEDGCFPRQIDSVLRKDFHFTRGLFELEDIMGLDVMAMARTSMLEVAARANGSSVPPPKRVGVEPSVPSPFELSNAWFLPSRPVFDISNALIATGTLGRKTREGWYKYLTPQEASLGYRLRHPIASWLWTGSAPNRLGTGNSANRRSAAGATTAASCVPMLSDTATTSAVAASSAASRQRFPLVSLSSLILQHNYSVEYRTIDCSKRRRVTRRPFCEEEIFERIVFVMVNEAAKIMADGIVTNSADIDCTSVYGFGFPAWKGGLCYYADHVAGIDKIVRKMLVYQRALGSEEFPAPCLALREMQAKGMTFASMFK